MSDERELVDKILTKFLLSTCQLRPRLTGPALQALLQGAAHTVQQADSDAESEVILRATGSAAEFYVKPMLPHLGDIDLMFHYSTQLAIPRGHPPPTQLPDEFHNFVRVSEIIDSEFSGYVYLQLRYLLTEDDDQNRYRAVEYQRKWYASNDKYMNGANVHGPATLYIDEHNANALPLDAVLYMRCLSWPSQAADWPTRHRIYGWPDSATVDRVVSNGCDVVRKAHPHCRQDEWMRRHQQRLSFSRAEIVLLSNWMPVQQIVYHMLRYFVKTEHLTDSADNTREATLSNYHIKTLMLWACEVNPKSWWTDDLSLVRICVKLLHNLATWLTEERCPHYFISNCNLFDKLFNMELIADQRLLMSIDRTWLSTWFVNNYILKCAELCPDNVSQLFHHGSRPDTIGKLQNAVSAILDWRMSNVLVEECNTIRKTVVDIPLVLSMLSLTVRSCVYWLTALVNIDTCLTRYFSAVAFLHISCKLSRNGLKDELMDVLTTIVGRCSTRRSSSQRSSVQSLSQATKLMKVVANKSRSTVQLIEIELSKAYLHRALRCQDSDSDSIYCLANVYLAVLYYNTGQYQTAINHSTLVTRSQGNSQCNLHVVQGELLPKIDDDIDNVSGLSVLYQYVLITALNQQQRQCGSLFTTELFAHYLLIRCLSECCYLTQISLGLTDEIQRYKKCSSASHQLLIADVLILKSTYLYSSHRFHPREAKDRGRKRDESPTGSYPSELNELLQQSAVEHLTAFRQIEARDFGSVATIVTTDFEAMYAYKHGDYQRCLQLSRQNVRSLLDDNVAHVVPTFLEFIGLLDDDIVSLTALALIVNPECRIISPYYVCISQLTLSLYQMSQCQMKLHHSVTSLAQTLDYIEDAQRRRRVDYTLELLTLKLTESLVIAYMTKDNELILI